MAVYLEKSEFQKSRAYSPAVITEGGRTVWLAGQTAPRDAAGADISGNFDAQVKGNLRAHRRNPEKSGRQPR